MPCFEQVYNNYYDTQRNSVSVGILYYYIDGGCRRATSKKE